MHSFSPRLARYAMPCSASRWPWRRGSPTSPVFGLEEYGVWLNLAKISSPNSGSAELAYERTQGSLLFCWQPQWRMPWPGLFSDDCSFTMASSGARSVRQHDRILINLQT